MDLTTTGSYQQSKARQLNNERKAEALSKEQLNKPLQKPVEAKLPEKPNPDYKIELSSPSAPSAPKLVLPDVKKAEKIAIDTTEEKIKDDVKEEVIKASETQATKDIKPGSQKRAAIFFIKGLDIFSSPSKSERGYAGVGRMAESVPGSRLYGWNQKDEMMEEIKKIHPEFPVILVGHSLGGDTAVEIAEELDSLDHKFRKVDLLVTIDAVGFQHDVIPQNVKNHLNFFGENDMFLNDGPHVARDHEKTQVINVLSAADHTELDDQKDIQYKITDTIQKTLLQKPG